MDLGKLLGHKHAKKFRKRPQNAPNKLLLSKLLPKYTSCWELNFFLNLCCVQVHCNTHCNTLCNTPRNAVFCSVAWFPSEKKAILFKIGPWLLKFQKRLVCLNFSALRSCVAHCVAECVAECCRVLQGHRNVATRFHKTPQVLCGELLSSLARQTLSRSWVQAHNTEPCLDQTTFASLCSLAVHLVLFHGLVPPGAANCLSSCH